MDRSDFSVLIGRLEREADTRPQLYVSKVAGAAALGYLGPTLVALEILAVCFAIGHSLVTGSTPSLWAVLAGVVGALTAAAMIRAFGVRIAEPVGLRITREEAPQLFAVIDGVSAKLHAPPLTSVTVNGEFNACIRQIPRWGIFGGYRNHLQLGVPLLLALSVEEFTAVLAHEIGHLGGQGRQFGGWIYRQRAIWNLLQPKFAEPANAIDRALAVFYAWYAPWFYAYSFALARNYEYECDRIAATLTSSETLGRALIKLELTGRFLAEVFWARFLARVEETPQPPYRPYSVLPRAFRIAEEDKARPRWLAEALRRYAADGDTHPSLAERLAAVDVSPNMPPPFTEAVALGLFGSSAARLVHYCDEVWRAENIVNWRKRHDEIKETHWKISQYEQHDSAALSAEDLWTKANLLLTVNRTADSLDTLMLLIAKKARHADAHMLVGRLLLAHGDERGLPYLLKAVEQRVELGETAGSIGYGYLMDRGRKGEALRFYQRVSQLMEA